MNKLVDFGCWNKSIRGWTAEIWLKLARFYEWTAEIRTLQMDWWNMANTIEIPVR